MITITKVSAILRLSNDKNQPVKNIQQVLEELDEIIDNSTRQQWAHGFFATLYRQVTADVAEGIEKGIFEDNERMECLDVLFAQRYLDAFSAYSAGSGTTRSWAVSFRANERRRSIILQYLLLGINAHINLDLGIAASETMEGGDLQDLHGDFKKINELLAARVDESQDKISRRSWLFGRIDKWFKNSDEMLANFSIGLARDGAWAFAREYHAAADREALLLERDEKIARLGERIEVPGRRLRWFLELVRWIENQRMPWND